jgi:membrane fusion protein (multidrug efflux system)
VTVRIALDKDEIKAHPLRIGLSMRARVDIADQSGSQLANLSHDSTAYTTRVFDRDTAAADELIAQIIADNAGVNAVKAAKDSSLSSNAAHLHAALHSKG